MKDIAELPYAGFLEGSVKILAATEGIESIVIAARKKAGGTMTGSWKASPEDMAVMCWALMEDAIMDTVTENAEMIRDALEDLEESEGET